MSPVCACACVRTEKTHKKREERRPKTKPNVDCRQQTEAAAVTAAADVGAAFTQQKVPHSVENVENVLNTSQLCNWYCYPNTITGKHRHTQNTFCQ